MPVLTYGVFQREDFTCPKCGWAGKGIELQAIELYESMVIDMGCPKCLEYMGCMMAPTTEEYEKFRGEFGD